jgi:hypothetical protein
VLGLDDMGSAALGAFAGVTFTFGNATTPASSGGNTTKPIAQINLPNYALPFTLNTTGPVDIQGQAAAGTPTNGGNTPQFLGSNATGGGITQHSSYSGPITGSINLNGGNSALQTVDPFLTGTWFWKL